MYLLPCSDLLMERNVSNHLLVLSFGDLHEDYNTEIIEEGEDYDVLSGGKLVLSRKQIWGSITHILHLQAF